MLDWLTVKIQHAHKPVSAGRVIALRPDGSIEWETLKAATVKGSYESKIQIRSLGELDKQGRATYLQISGNPSKFLQGHNVFGSSDVAALLLATIEKINSALDIGTVSRLAVASAKVSRVDFTKSLEFPSLDLARSYIRQVGMRARTRNGRPMIKGHTLTFQKSSRRWSLVVYSKGDEVRAHELPEDLPERESVINEADKLVRIELRLRGLELEKMGLRTVRRLTEERLVQAYSDYVRKVEMKTHTTIPDEVIMNMPRHLRSTYFLWREGLDIAATMRKATFYRHRSELASYGVDISVPFDPSATCEVVPISTVITGKPHVIPQWARDSGLLFAA